MRELGTKRFPYALAVANREQIAVNILSSRNIDDTGHQIFVCDPKLLGRAPPSLRFVDRTITIVTSDRLLAINEQTVSRSNTM